ncbi:cation transporter [Antarcticibacterium flavum]|uniref:Cation transporter n=1 Tax=Antarcticibacterium flavum TaxID=2058175 RepID=A0A5B7X2S0_9FLAO|nr:MULTISPECIES: cation diffusion facilitator family transporter [Antarcticibacterium]MCM4160072.1 cation transporter [Antarcticibacterium sp. W02-3]QCY69629.1 cation transporter [Antarcticibacterium flavum]
MGHHHHHSSSQVRGKNLLIAIILNIGITLAQIIGGFLSGSLALLSDALHNLSDVISLAISYVANKLAKRDASLKRTFGYKRAEIIAAFVNAATLIIIAVLLIIEAVERFRFPQEIDSGLVIWLSIVAILGNGFSVLLLKRDSKANMNMRSAYLHLITDFMASVAVLIGGLLMKFYQFYWVDSLLTLAIAIYLIIVGYDLLRTSTRVLMLFTPTDLALEEIAERITQLPAIRNVHHIHVWQLNEDETHLEAHIDFNNDIKLSQFDAILVDIEELVYHEFGINHVNIQPEFGKCDSKDLIVQD